MFNSYVSFFLDLGFYIELIFISYPFVVLSVAVIIFTVI
jgi:hypothetical protein